MRNGLRQICAQPISHSINPDISIAHPLYCSERVAQANGRELLELPIAQVVVVGIGIVESRIEEDVGRDVLRHLQLERVLPLNLSTLVRSKSPEAALLVIVRTYRKVRWRCTP